MRRNDSWQPVAPQNRKTVSDLRIESGKFRYGRLYASTTAMPVVLFFPRTTAV